MRRDDSIEADIEPARRGRLRSTILDILEDGRAWPCWVLARRSNAHTLEAAAVLHRLVHDRQVVEDQRPGRWRLRFRIGEA